MHREEQSSQASSFWPSYWGYRGAVHEYEEYSEDQENRVGRVVTKSGGGGEAPGSVSWRIVTHSGSRAEHQPLQNLPSFF